MRATITTCCLATLLATLVVPIIRANDADAQFDRALEDYRARQAQKLADRYAEPLRSALDFRTTMREFQTETDLDSAAAPLFFSTYTELNFEDPPPAPPAEDMSGDVSVEELAKQTQNPLADLISLPFQNNTNFEVGYEGRVQNVMNIQPIVPINLNEEWILISRAILPVIYQPAMLPGQSDEFGLGDLQYTGWFSPTGSSSFTWGVGPVLRFPTATDSALGSDKWSAGPSLVVVTMPGKWVIGGIVQNVWSYCGDSDTNNVNEMLIQAVVNYNIKDGWYLTSAPIITANWDADSSNRWTVPLGGGFGKVFHFGERPVNISLQGYYNVEKPELAGDWTLRFQVQLLFPKGKK